MASMASIETCVLDSLEMALLYFAKHNFVVMKLEVGSFNSLEYVLCKPPIDKHCAFRSH